MSRRAIGYSRQSLSNPDDADQSISIAAQERRIREEAQREGYELIALHSDVDVRGGVSSRAGLDQVLASLRGGFVDAVIIFDVSRLSREVVLFSALFTEIQKKGCRLMSVREPTDEPWLLYLHAALAQKTRDDLSIRVGDAMRERARLGQFVGAVPIGYERVEDREASGRVVRKLQVTALAAVVRDAYARYDAGESIAGIARWLNEPGQPSPHRAPKWSVPSVSWLLRNPVYAGDVVVKGSTRSNPILVRDAHPAIVDRETWERVQRRLGAVGRREIPRARKPGRHWLEGRVFCACGAPMYLFVKRHSSDGHELKSWGCRKDNAARNLTGSGGGCPLSRSVVGNRRVEPAVLTQFAADLGRMGRALPVAVETLADREDAGRGDVEARLVEIRKRRRGLARAVETADDPTFFVAQDNKLAADERALMAQLHARPTAITSERIARAHAMAREMAERVGRAAAMGDQKVLRELAQMVGLRVEVEGDAYRVGVGYDEVFGRLLGGD